MTKQSTGQSNITDVLDVDGSDVTNAGLGGKGRVLVYGATYHLTLSGEPAQGYQVSKATYVAQPLLGGSTSDVTVTVLSSSSNPTCGAGPSNAMVLCADATGQATGTLQVTSSNPEPDQHIVYVVFSLKPNNQNTNTESAPGQFAVTVGPKGAGAPTPTALASQTPTPGGSNPGANDFCRPSRAVPGLGSAEVYTAIVDAVLPTLTGQCPEDANQITYSQVPDDAAARQVLAAQPVYSFAGMDRPLTVQELGGDPTSGGNPIGTELNGGGVNQFPIDLQPLVITYNLPDTKACGNNATVQLSSLALSGISSGAVTKWNDQLITKDNSTMTGCNLPNLVAHDLGTASTVLKDYLSKRNPQWKAYEQASINTSQQASLANQWPPTAPESCTANGSQAMSLCVEGQQGAIG